MDRLKRPLQIPPSYPIYADQHDIKKLLLAQPEDPLNFLIDTLKSDRPRARVAVIGPPGSGKTYVADYLASKTGAQVVNSSSSDIDARNGFIVDGVSDRASALKLQEKGHLLDRLIVLETNDGEMLAARQKGKVKDPISQVHYHPVLNWPREQKIIDRLEKDAYPFDQAKFGDRLDHWRRNCSDIIAAYPSRIVTHINADQPIDDVCSIAFDNVAQRRDNCEKRTARVILLGPPGSGKRETARMLAQKWGMLAIDVETAIDTELATGSRLAQRIKEEPRSALLITQVLEKSLSTQRGALHGWVVFNFPDSFNIATFARSSQFTPNRIVLMRQDGETSEERLSWRVTDPVTGVTYHQLYHPPPSATIKTRSVQRESDKAEHVKTRYDKHVMSIADYEELIDEFGGFVVNSMQPLANVFEVVESKLAKPLPTVFH